VTTARPLRDSRQRICELVENFTFAFATLRRTCCGDPRVPMTSRSGAASCSMSTASPMRRAISGSPDSSSAASNRASFWR
jgi:hypothetical protein